MCWLNQFCSKYLPVQFCRICLLVAICQAHLFADESAPIRQRREQRPSLVRLAPNEAMTAGSDEMKLPTWLTPDGRRSMKKRRKSQESQPGVAPLVGHLEKRELLTIGPDGWSQFAPSADSRVIYVSSSDGIDTNDGLSAASPKATLSNAISLMRKGYPDWLLLKHGDSFAANIQLKKGGRSADEPMLFSGYGEGPRPIIDGPGFTYWGPNNPDGFSWNHVAIVGLDFRGDETGKGLHFAGGMDGLLIEGNAFSANAIGIHLQDPDATDDLPAINITVRRNTFIDVNEQGLLAGNMRFFTLEENIFDRSGYGAGIGNAGGEEGPTIYKHNVYFTNAKHLTVINNIFARGSNFGTKLATDTIGGFTDFVIENNLYFNNGISMDSSSSAAPGITTYRHQRGLLKDNVFTEIGREFVGGSKQDMVAWMRNTENIDWDGNHFVHKALVAGNPMFHWGNNERHKDVTIENSVVYDWLLGVDYPVTKYFEYNAYNESPEVGVTDLQLVSNEIDLPAASYVDPTRTVGSYYATIGGVNDPVAFLEAARNMSKANWNSAYTADAVNDYIRAGFARVLATPVFTTPNNTTTSDPLRTVSWNTIDGADSYEVWYANLTTGQNPFFKATVTSASYTPSTALPIGRYQIFVQATQVDGPASPWSSPIALRVNAAPVLNSLPTDGANARPQLTWSALPGAVTYELTAKNMTTGASNVVQVSNLTETSFTPESDLGFGLYRFWVRGFDVKGVFSAWSVAQDYSRRDVTTILQPVVFDGMNSPPTVSWSSVPGATRYELWASNLTTGANGILRNVDITSTSFVPAKPLPFGKNRFWVRPIDANGSPGKWSQPLDAVNQATLLSPVLPTFERRPTFTWVALPGVSSSEAYISINGTVINPKGLPGNFWTPDSDLPTGTLKWWVRLCASNGAMGSWSAPAETYIGGLSAILSAGVPGNDLGRIGVFAWKAVTGASRYILQVTRVGVGVAILESNLTGTSYTTSAPLAAGEYRAWIKAIDGTDNVTGLWSKAFAFTVVGVQAEDHNSPAGPQFAVRQLESVLSDERLTAVKQIAASETAAVSQQVVRPNTVPADREGDRHWGIETESLGDWTRPNMSRDALMSELDADLIDMVMSESIALAAAMCPLNMPGMDR